MEKSFLNWLENGLDDTSLAVFTWLPTNWQLATKKLAREGRQNTDRKKGILSYSTSGLHYFFWARDDSNIVGSNSYQFRETKAQLSNTELSKSTIYINSCVHITPRFRQLCICLAFPRVVLVLIMYCTLSHMLCHVTSSANGQLYTIKINKDLLMRLLKRGA